MIKQEHTKSRTQPVSQLGWTPVNLPAPTPSAQMHEIQAERFICLLSEAFASEEVMLSRKVRPGFA